MKKIITLFITAMLLLSFAGCASSDNSPKSLESNGLDIAIMLDFLAESEDYAKLLSASDEINGIIQEIGEQDYSAPRLVFKIEGMEEAMLNSLAEDIELSQELKDIIGYKFSSTLSSQINAMNGVSYVAATSILTYEESFIFKGISKPLTHLYLYNDKYGVLVNHTPSENNIVSSFGSFVLNENFSQIETTEDLMLLLEQFGITNVEISLVD